MRSRRRHLSRLAVLPTLATLTACQAPDADPDVDPTEVATEAATVEFPLRIQAVLLADDAAGSRCGGRPCTTPGDIADFTNLANTIFAKAGVRFTFDPEWDWTVMVDADLTRRLNSGDWNRPNELADRYPGKIVVFLRVDGQSNFAYPPDVGQRIPLDAALPGTHPNFIAHVADREGAIFNKQNFSHELGHFMGLFHTQITWSNCYPTSDGCVTSNADAAIAELQKARGKKGALDGDLLSDTPEDPGPAYWTDHDFAVCDPKRTAVKVNGVTYKPDRKNVMSYFACNGGTGLSNGQANMVRASLRHPSRRLLTQPVCNADFHNFPVGNFQSCFDYWVTRGLWPQALTVSKDAQRISGSFQSAPFRGEVHHLMSAGGFDDVTARLDAFGWTPKSLSVTSGRYTSLWEPSGGSEVISYRDLPESSFNSVWQSLFAQGYTQTDWYIDGDRFSASWTKKPSFSGFAAYYGLTREDFDARNATFTAQGLRVDHLIGHMMGGASRFAAIWVPSGANRQVTISSSGSEHEAARNQMNGRGCRLHQLNSFDSDSFAAVWACP
jgi:hypothetical protein